MRFKIYCIKNLINGKVYIGKSTDVKKRWETHKKNASKSINRRLYDSMNKYGYDNFIVDVIDESDCEISINDKERYYIKLNNSNLKEFGYNMTDGGDGGNVISNYTDEQRLIYSQKLKKSKLESNFNHSEESKKIMSEKATGRILTEETRNKISDTVKMKIESGEFKPNTTGLKNGQTIGFKHSVESREKIRKSKENKTYDEIYGTERSKLIKEKKSNDWIGEKNPNYQDVNGEELLSHLKNGMQTRQIAILYNVTEQTIINKCRKFFNKKPQEIRDGKY